jgi:hypothetical protein
VAWDPVKQRAAWRAPYPVVEGGGVLTTAANLVFQGRADGILAAYRATDGKQVWQFDAGTGIMAPPVTYTVDGVQYVSVMAGWGGPTATFNAPNQGKRKPGYGRMPTFALGAKHADPARICSNRTSHTGNHAGLTTVIQGNPLHGELRVSWPRRRGGSTSDLRSRVRCTSSSRQSCSGCARVTRDAAVQGSPEARSGEGDSGLRDLTRQGERERTDEMNMIHNRSRREFMGLTAGAVAATAFGPAWFSRAVGALAAAQAGTADLIVVNANVYTVDSRMPKAVAFAVKNNRFIAVGTNDEIRGLAGKDTRTSTRSR